MYKLTVEIFLAGTNVFNNLSLTQLNKRLLVLSELYDEFEFDYYIEEV